jgi:hypothetical protein
VSVVAGGGTVPLSTGLRAVTVNDVLDGHTVLDISCLDRLYLSGFVQGLQTAGGVVYFLHEVRGMPITSPAVFDQIGTKFRAAMRTFADVNRIPVVRFRRGDRKVEVMRPYLDRAASTGRPQVAAIGVSQEFATVWTARKRDTDPAKPPQFSFTKEQRRVTVYYLYLWDDDFGAAFIKICSYFPYPIKLWLNGHEWAKRQATKAGIGFTALSNGFALADDPTGLQAICDRLGPGAIRVFFERWTSLLPLPLGTADRDGGFWWELTMRQVETSRTIVFDAPRHARSFFEALVADNLDLGRPEQVELIFKRNPAGRKAAGVFKTAIDRHTEGVSINVFYKHSRVKQYLKDGRALRVETVINDAYDIGCQRLLPNLDDLQAKARAINERLLDTERVGQGTVLASPAFERIAQSTVTDDGRRAPALRFGDPRVQALAGALANTLFAVTDITNKSLRALMTELLGTAYSMNQASYDLARLRLNGLITRIPEHHRYTLTTDGIQFAVFYTKVHDRVLRPLLATTTQPHAPPELRAALRTIDQAVDQRITHARLRPAA